MKKLVYLILFIFCIGFLCACAQTEETGIVNSWDCTVIRSEMTADDRPTYSEEIIISSTGCLTFENESDFDVWIVLYANGVPERGEPLKSNSKKVLYGINKDVEYTMEVHLSVEPGTEIKLLAHDGVMDFAESEPGSKKPILVEKAIKLAKKYVKTDKEYYANFDNPSISEILGDENLRMKDRKTHERISSSEFAGKELYVIRFACKDINTGSTLVYVDKNKGVVLGSGTD